MDELITDLAARTDLDRASIEKALGLIIAFLEREDRSRKVTAMIDRVEGARSLAAAHGSRGGIFSLLNELSSAGLGLGEIRTVAGGFLDFARLRLGPEPVGEILRAIPALAQFL